MKFLFIWLTLLLANKICISQQLIFDTPKIAILPVEAKNFYGELDSSNHACSMTQEDIEEVEKMLLQSITEYASPLSPIDKKYYSIDLRDFNYYRRQYVCYKNKKGEKIVYVDCFCTAMVDWHNYMVIVDDGGQCFFNVKINLTTKKWFDYTPGGYA